MSAFQNDRGLSLVCERSHRARTGPYGGCKDKSAYQDIRLKIWQSADIRFYPVLSDSIWILFQSAKLMPFANRAFAIAFLYFLPKGPYRCPLCRRKLLNLLVFAGELQFFPILQNPRTRFLKRSMKRFLWQSGLSVVSNRILCGVQAFGRRVL